jgi:hypothetical protein
MAASESRWYTHSRSRQIPVTALTHCAVSNRFKKNYTSSWLRLLALRQGRQSGEESYFEESRDAMVLLAAR